MEIQLDWGKRLAEAQDWLPSSFGGVGLLRLARAGFYVAPKETLWPGIVGQFNLMTNDIEVSAVETPTPQILLEVLAHELMHGFDARAGLLNSKTKDDTVDWRKVAATPTQAVVKLRWDRNAMITAAIKKVVDRGGFGPEGLQYHLSIAEVRARWYAAVVMDRFESEVAGLHDPADVVAFLDQNFPEPQEVMELGEASGIPVRWNPFPGKPYALPDFLELPPVFTPKPRPVPVDWVSVDPAGVRGHPIITPAKDWLQSPILRGYQPSRRPAHHALLTGILGRTPNQRSWSVRSLITKVDFLAGRDGRRKSFYNFVARISTLLGVALRPWGFRSSDRRLFLSPRQVRVQPLVQGRGAASLLVPRNGSTRTLLRNGLLFRLRVGHSAAG